MNERRDELRNVVENNPVYFELVDNVVFLENKLDELRKLPMLKINPANAEQQKSTPAAKLYKEYLQQYLNALKLLEKMAGGSDEIAESPLRTWVKSRLGDD